MLLAPPREAELRRAHGDHVVEPIAAIDVQVQGHRAESVGRVQVPVALRVMRAAPQSFVPGLEEDRAQVVVVGRAAVLELTEQSRAHHLQHQQLVVAVVAVLHHDAVPARPLRRVDELPAILERVAPRALRWRRACRASSRPGRPARATPMAWPCRRCRCRPAGRASRSRARHRRSTPGCSRGRPCCTISRAWATFSGTMSQSAVIRTCSTPSHSFSTLRPRRPVPTMAMRTTSRRSNGTSIIEARAGGLRLRRSAAWAAGAPKGEPGAGDVRRA